ncbi:methyl-accepting chemotaxis protein [Pseudophaeobacter sp. A-200-2]|uniref:methyl-accepting chemotaxis protein n=1 Tax=Pseudophaeobacter sp. A-200-2 TaxID=3098145 RepID=UPI0034D44B7D
MKRQLSRFLGMSIKKKLLLPILACIVVSNIAYTVFWASKHSSALIDAFEDEVGLAQRFVGPPVAAAVWDFNSDAAQGVIQGVADMENALFAQVVVDGETFTEVFVSEDRRAEVTGAVETLLADPQEEKTTEVNQVVYVKFPISLTDGTVVGEMVMGFDNSAIQDTVSALYLQSAVIGLAICLAIGLIVYFSAASVTRPLDRIVDRIDALRNGDTDSAVPEKARGDELGRLAAAVVEFVEAMRANAELEGQSRAAAKEQADVVQELANGLNNLSKGNLGYRITTEMSAEYAALRSDFNQTAEALDDVIGRVLSTVGDIEGQIGEMAVGTDELSRRTENQAATLEETAAALDNITSNVQSATEQTKAVEGTIAETTSEAMRSGDIVKRTVVAMQEINEASGKISEINSVIDDISFQTNLLALNAGVEAARAGEAGRGFAVVASEVRSLALKSANSANEIRELIQSSSEKVKIGVELVDEAGKSLDEIITKIQSVSTLASQIAESSGEQASTISEINSGMTELDRVTQQNASMVLKSSEQGKSLQQAATELAQLVAQFKPSSSSFASAPTPSAHGDWDLSGQGYDDDFGQELMAG